MDWERAAGECLFLVARDNARCVACPVDLEHNRACAAAGDRAGKRDRSMKGGAAVLEDLDGAVEDVRAGERAGVGGQVVRCEEEVAVRGRRRAGVPLECLVECGQGEASGRGHRLRGGRRWDKGCCGQTCGQRCNGEDTAHGGLLPFRSQGLFGGHSRVGA